MRTALIALAATALATSAGAATVNFNFDTPTGNLGATHTYTVDGLSVIATAEDTPIGESPDLWGKNAGCPECGLGLADDPSGDHEIAYNQGFVQLDVSGLIGHVVSMSAAFTTGSTTDGEEWAVYGSNTAGSLGTQLATGTSQGGASLTTLPDWGTYKYYNFDEITPVKDDNILLSTLTATTSVPEPATWAMMLMGVFGQGGLLRTARGKRLATA